MLTHSNTAIEFHRRMIAIAGAVYFAWWFMVELALPGSFNPFWSRFAVVLFFVGAFVAGSLDRRARARSGGLFLIGTCLLTSHYFYLFDSNVEDPNWMIGAYVTIVAIAIGHMTRRLLLAYSIFVVIAATVFCWPHPELLQSVFLPGLVTMLLLVNFGVRTRLKLLSESDESSRRFEELFNAAYEGIAIHDGERLLEYNAGMERVFRRTRDELRGINLLELVAAESHETVRRHIAQGLEESYEVTGRLGDGTKAQLEITGRSIGYRGRPARMVSIRDISGLQERERDRAAARAAEEAVRIRDEFISIASHELKTPITSIRLVLDLLGRANSTNAKAWLESQRTTDLLARSSRQIERLTRIIDDMLDVTRLSKSGLPFALEPIDLAALTRETIESLEGQLREASIEAKVEISSPLPVLADRFRLEQVMTNLMTNAVKYGRQRPIEVAGRVDGAEIEVTITDQGIGIAHEHLESIFNRFTRATSTSNVSGLGLGLYICRQVVEAHGGRIFATSTLGEGSSFTVRLPRAPSASA